MNQKIQNSLIFLAELLFGFIFLFLQSCAQPSKKNSPAAKTPELQGAISSKPPSSFSDTLLIHYPSAVFYNPDSLQLKKIEAITEKREYETEVHNCFFQMRNARMVLKQYWPKIHIIETSTKRYLSFVKADQTITTIDLNGKGDMCGLFLFDGKKEPALVDMMNIDTALGFYFSK